MRELRSRFDVPIIAIGDRCDEISCVITLELGADDYIAKLLGLRELLARARAVLRRQNCGRTARTNGSQRGGFRFCGWTLERRARRLVRPDGSPLVLTKAEYVLLVAFLEAPQQTLSREQLLHATRIHEDVFDRSIDVRVWRLRRKLEIDPRAPEIIKTQRAIGYLFTPRLRHSNRRSVGFVRSQRPAGTTEARRDMSDLCLSRKPDAAVRNCQDGYRRSCHAGPSAIVSMREER